jgi:hypothetical protein
MAEAYHGPRPFSDSLALNRANLLTVSTVLVVDHAVAATNDLQPVKCPALQMFNNLRAQTQPEKKWLSLDPLRSFLNRWYCKRQSVIVFIASLETYQEEYCTSS